MTTAHPACIVALRRLERGGVCAFSPGCLRREKRPRHSDPVTLSREFVGAPEAPSTWEACVGEVSPGTFSWEEVWWSHKTTSHQGKQAAWGQSRAPRAAGEKCSRGPPRVCCVVRDRRRHALPSSEWKPRRPAKSHLLSLGRPRALTHLGWGSRKTPLQVQREEDRTCPVWPNTRVFSWRVLDHKSAQRQKVDGVVHTFISPFSHTARQPAL